MGTWMVVAEVVVGAGAAVVAVDDDDRVNRDWSQGKQNFFFSVTALATKHSKLECLAKFSR